MTTVHFVYPRDAARNSSPFRIANEVADRLVRDHDVRLHRDRFHDQVRVAARKERLLMKTFDLVH